MPVPSWNHPPPLVSVSNLGPWFLDRPTISHPAHQPASQYQRLGLSVSDPLECRMVLQNIQMSKTRANGVAFYRNMCLRRDQTIEEIIFICRVSKTNYKRGSTPCLIVISGCRSRWIGTLPPAHDLSDIYLRNKLLKTWKESFISLCDSDL